jgi:hypothetical protein
MVSDSYLADEQTLAYLLVPQSQRDKRNDLPLPLREFGDAFLIGRARLTFPRDSSVSNWLLWFLNNFLALQLSERQEPSLNTIPVAGRTALTRFVIRPSRRTQLAKLLLTSWQKLRSVSITRSTDCRAVCDADEQLLMD